MIGKQLSEILCEIEETIINSDASESGNPAYTNTGFRAATYIFMHVLMDKMWELQELEDMDPEFREQMSQKCGSDLRNFIKTYTNLDTFDFYR
jgi:hypothetical protein